MEIRKFIFTIASRFDPRGFKQADDAAKRLRKLGDEVKAAVDGISKAHRKSGEAAEKAAARSAKAAAKQEQDFRKVIAAAERKAAREDAAADKAAKAVVAASAKATRAAIRESQKRTQAHERAAEKSAKAEIRAAERAAAATRREAKKASRARLGEIARLDRAIKKANQDELKSRERVNKLLIENDKRTARRRAEIARQAGERRAEARADRRAFAGDVGSAAASTAGTVLTGIGIGVSGLAALGTVALQTGTKFESLRAQLKTVEGSAAGADAAFSKIQSFAKRTPFEVDNLTEGFIQLRVRGVDPTEETLTSLGDLASAFGQDFMSVTDAIGAAARGELDPIEKFGISAKIAGDKIKLSFKDQTVEVERSAQAVTDALTAFGQMAGVQGAMAEQSATAGGKMSNLADAVSAFFDKVSQSGSLESFRRLLDTVIAKFDESDNFAQILSDSLSAIIDNVEQFVSDLTAEDIAAALESLKDFAFGVADGFETAVEVFRWFVEMSGSVGDALRDMTLLALGLVAAMTGPGGIVVAAGLVGTALGSMIANAIADWSGLNAAIAQTDAVITDLEASIKNIEDRIGLIENFRQKSEQREKEFEANQEKRRQKAKTELGTQTAGLGAGLAKDIDAKDAQAIAELQQRDPSLGRAALLTREGQVVVDAVESAARKRVEQAEQRARREARKRGQNEDEAAAAARSATMEANRQSRKKAFETAQATFQQTGSAEAAGEAGAAAIGKVKGAAKGRKGKAADTFFDFEKDAAAAAKKQGETFAERELQRFIAEGMTGKAAIAAAQEAGKRRAEELEKRFLEAGRIFDASADNILDILGLRGPGSVLEGRPPPNTLLITISPVFKFIETFNQTIESVAGSKALTDITGEGGQAAVEQGLEEFNARVMAIIEAALNLQTARLLQADGGGRLPQRPVT